VSAKVIWLLLFLALYWGYCLYQGLAGMRKSKTASDYFIAGRQLPLWVFVLAATAASFSGWTFMGHPSLVYRDGFQYAYASFYAITIPFTGVLFLKRQWMLGKRYGYVTPGEMLCDYFQGDLIRVLTVVVAVLYSVPYLGVQFGAAGFLFSVVTDGLISKVAGMALFALVITIYVASGGLRAVAYVQTMQCILLAVGIMIVGVIALNQIGGFEALQTGLAWLGKSEISKWGVTEQGYNSYFAIPGVIQWTAGLGKETPVGGLWTGMMILTYMFALMGIQASPSFSMWSFSNTNPAPFAPQQVWASSFAIGLILFTFTAFQGMGAHFLGGNPLVNETGFPQTLPAVQEFMAANNGAYPLPPSIAKNPDSIVPHIFNLMENTAPWLIGLLSICAFAAMESTGTAYASTCSGIVTRDLYKRYINPAAGHGAQKLFGRVSVVVIVLVAFLVSTFSSDALVLLGGLAVAFGFQMFPSLAAATWFPWITRQGATWGLFAGLIGVILTDSTGPAIFGDALPWGRWPWTIHSAGWGILANVVVCAVMSMMTQNAEAKRHRESYHSFLSDHSALPASKKGLIPVAYLITAFWFFFGIGPGAVIGNDLFGAPDAGIDGWTFGIPSIWAWQILFWAIGVFMMWFLAYKMEMSTIPSTEVTALVEDIGETALSKPT
jgi:solute:Na+ symporter, SSS family